MIGKNTLELNTATMIVAVQEYLDKRMGEFAPKVTDVKASRDNISPTFLVVTEGKE